MNSSDFSSEAAVAESTPPMAPATAATPKMMPPAGADKPMEEVSKEMALTREKNSVLDSAAKKDSLSNNMELEWKAKVANGKPQDAGPGDKRAEEFFKQLDDVERAAIVAQNQPAREPAKQPADQLMDGTSNQVSLGRSKLGLLSLAIDLAAPSGSLEK